MLIIIEGIDGIGKTTLANKMSEFYSILVYKSFGRNREFIPKKLSEIFYESWGNGVVDYSVADFIRQCSVNVILDRSLLSLYPYGGLDGEDNKSLYLTREWWEMISKENLKVILLCSMDPDKINREKGRGRMLGKEFSNKIIQDRYFYLVENLPDFKKYLFSVFVDGMNKNEVFQRVKENIEC